MSGGTVQAKRMELLRELVPATSRVAVLVNPVDAVSAGSQLRDIEATARAMGLQIQVLNAGTSSEINAAFASFVRERPDALFVANQSFFTSRRVQLALLTAHHSIPAIYGVREIVEVGGLMSYEPNGCVSSGRRLYRSYPQGHQAGGPAGGAGVEVRAGDQSRDRQVARPHRARQAARSRIIPWVNLSVTGNGGTLPKAASRSPSRQRWAGDLAGGDCAVPGR